MAGLALVTGATGGIGRAMALALRDAGHPVLALGRNPEALAELAGQGVEALSVDLSDAGAVAALAVRPVEVLVNNAGLMPPPGPFAAMDAAEIGRSLVVNLQATLALTRAILPGMIARGAGDVVFTGSTAGHAPSPNFAVYAAAKAAVSSFAASLRAETAAQGIRVLELVPGRVETGLYASVLSADQRAAMYGDGHALQPGDVAAALMAALAMPRHASLSRIDILPARPVRPISL